ncbi:protein YhfH [Halalkalibacter alkalisediminis]|uniref:Protein YhfH n=1 Tax=Halalkalibacter alkalisediminis TaxID=935616 RepID=A0ABV6NBH9_9BACI|nr:protein YhfH [Halalkalibacter alkalisediminis]
MKKHLTPPTRTLLTLEPKTCHDCGDHIVEINESCFTQCEQCLRHVEHS